MKEQVRAEVRQPVQPTVSRQVEGTRRGVQPEASRHATPLPASREVKRAADDDEVVVFLGGEKACEEAEDGR